jgi:hypothetical protein
MRFLTLRNAILATLTFLVSNTPSDLRHDCRTRELVDRHFDQRVLP